MISFVSGCKGIMRINGLVSKTYNFNSTGLFQSARYEETMLIFSVALSFPILSLLLTKAQGRKDFWKPSKSCHVGIHAIALTEYSQMCTNVPGFQFFLKVSLHHFLLAKLATSCIRVKKISVLDHYHRLISESIDQNHRDEQMMIDCHRFCVL